MRVGLLPLRPLSLVGLGLALMMIPTACQDLTTDMNTVEESTATSSESATTTDTRVYMPQLVGLSEEEAKAQLEDLGVEYEVRGWPTPNNSKHGKVQEQDVPEGTEVTGETEVEIKVGREGIEVPGLFGLTDDAARHLVESLGLSISITYDSPYPPVAHVFEPEPVYLVTSQSPSGGSYILVGGAVKVTCEPPAAP